MSEEMSNGVLAGKIAIVTGASRGIGHAIAKELSRSGARVMLAARDGDLLAKVVGEIENASGNPAFTICDLREADAPAELVARTIAAWGGLDILVNNAGATQRGDFLTLPDEAWGDGFALKFFGSVRLTRAAWPHLEANGGSIVNIVGVGGRTPGAEFAIGGSVNAALLSLTKSLADRGVGCGVQVNAINPGSIRTDRLSKRLEAEAKSKGISIGEAGARMVKEAKTTRIGEPQDIASLVRFIVSPEGRFLQGALIDMDGGQTKTI